MNPSLLFFIACIPTRIILAYLAYLFTTDKNKYKEYRMLIIFITAMIGVGFWTIYIKGWRKTGVETGEKPIWWNSLRPFHGTIYLLFTVLALMGYENAWMLLVIDVMIGIGAELYHISHISHM